MGFLGQSETFEMLGTASGTASSLDDIDKLDGLPLALARGTIFKSNAKRRFLVPIFMSTSVVWTTKSPRSTSMSKAESTGTGKRGMNPGDVHRARDRHRHLDLLEGQEEDGDPVLLAQRQ